MTILTVTAAITAAAAAAAQAAVILSPVVLVCSCNEYEKNLF